MLNGGPLTKLLKTQVMTGLHLGSYSRGGKIRFYESEGGDGA